MANSFFDWLMPFMRAKNNWIPIYVIMIGCIIYRFKYKSFIPILLCIITVAIADQTASGIFKPLFQRLRPCNNLQIQSQLRMIIDCGSGFSFISSHAANHFALAIYFSFLFKELKWLLYVLLAWAIVICFSQVYVAYHYPSDVLVGGLMGCIISLLMIKFSKRRIESCREK